MIKVALGALAALLITGSANAAVSFTSAGFDTGTPTGQTVVDTFDSSIARGYTFVGGELEQGTNDFAAAPAGDTSQYTAVMKDQVALLHSDGDLASLSVYIGSIDSYNYIGFFDHSQFVAAFRGAQLVEDPSGDQLSASTNRLFDFDLGDQPVNTIAFGSTNYSFEFDNIAAQTVSGVPEPTTWAFMIAGIAGIGLMLRRTKQTTAAAVI